MKKKLNKAIASVVAATLSAAAANAVYAKDFSDYSLDRVFDEDRTLYYVETSNGDIADFEIDGYTEVKKAEAAAVGEIGAKNVTVLKNNETGTEYRFVFYIPEKISLLNITEAEVSSDGNAVVKGICGTDGKLTAVILKPEEAFSEKPYEYESINKTEMEKYVQTAFELENISKSDEEQTLFTYSFPEGSMCGMYRVIIFGNEINEYKDIFYVSRYETERIAREFNSLAANEPTAENIGKMREYIEKNHKALYIDPKYYNKLSDVGKKMTAKLMMGREYTHEEIKTEFIKNLAAAWTADGNDISAVADAYPDTVRLALYEKYLALKNKSLTNDAIKAAVSYDSLCDIFNKITALSVLNESEPGNISSVIRDYKSYLISDAAYSHYTKNENACIRNIQNKSFETPEKLEAAILASKTETPSEDNHGGGSGGGGGGSKISMTAPAEQSPVNNTGKNETYNKLPFKDIDNYMWAYTAIEHLYNNGICSGTSETEFSPQNNILREEAVKLIINAFGIEASEQTENNFTDVKGGEWYEKPVGIAVKKGIIKGISEDTFGIGENITRQDLAVIIYRAVKESAMNINIIIDNKAELSDLDDVSDYASEAVSYLIDIGAIRGTDGKFLPKNYITRAEAAQMIYSVIKIR